MFFPSAAAGGWGLGGDASQVLEECEAGRPGLVESLFLCSDRFVGGMRPPTPRSRGDQSPYNPLKRPCIGWQVHRGLGSWAATSRMGIGIGKGIGVV
jgi:hypothetical protein